MPRAKLAQLGLMAAILGSVAVAADRATPQVDPREEEITHLKQVYQDELNRNRILQSRIRQLENEVSGLKSKLGAAIAQEHRLPSPQHVPETWKRGEINGMTFYIIPLGDNPQPAPQTTLKSSTKTPR